MDLSKWADRQERKGDILRTIEEAYFQSAVMGFFSTTVNAIDTTSFQDWLNLIVQGLKETEAHLWRFKGRASEWTVSHEMIVKGKVRWDKRHNEELKFACAMEVGRQMFQRDVWPTDGPLSEHELRRTVQERLASMAKGFRATADELAVIAIEEKLLSGGQITAQQSRAKKRLIRSIEGAPRS
jgi:hypothetical protein